MAQVPSFAALSDIYSDSLLKHGARYQSLIESFVDLYGAKPDFIARAPGRVNIIGEHIDYCGFPVFPMAIAQDTLIAVRANGTDAIRLANTASEKYPSREFSATGDIFEIDSTIHEWSNYFKCGYKGLFEHLGREDGKGFDALLDGKVPTGSGLSSSSAFVCATQLVLVNINGFNLTQTELASVAANSERYVGVAGGAMDQTACYKGQKGSALFIEFHPALTVTPVKIPDPSISFVIANTLVVSDKHVSAPVCYNLRVVETRIGALMLAKHLGLADHPVCKSLDPLTFKIVMDEFFADQDTAGKDEVQVWVERLSAMLGKVDELFGTQPQGFTREECASYLGTTVEALEKQIHADRFPVRADRFKLLQRAQHVYSETLRVVKFRQICESGDPDTDYFTVLGSLMNQSQDSCRDLFECSCPELDEICAIARSAGSYGSRLTGAGWGGCSVHMVPANKVDDVKRALAEKYYAKHHPDLTKEQLADAVFATTPSSGAAFYTLE
ncbi:galactokinase [Dipsacomyces acuminosporus]|nr:galactokinase [Dipsacomyces acuminosporus]